MITTFSQLVCLVQLFPVEKLQLIFFCSNYLTSLLRHAYVNGQVRPRLWMKSTRSSYEYIGDSKGDLRHLTLLFTVLHNAPEPP